MGKQILISIVAAVLASVATVLIVFSLGLDGRHERERRMTELEADVEKRVRTSEKGMDTALRRVDRAQADARVAREDAATARAAAGAPGNAEGASGLTAPDGTAYISMAELERVLAERIPEGGIMDHEEVPVVEAKTIAEIADEMGLSANQEMTLDVILRESEEEMLAIFFGDLPIDEIVARAKRAKEDPEEQARMVQVIATRAFANFGKLATFESRVQHRVEDALGEELATDFLARPRKPVLSDDLDTVFKEIFD